jgi:hypothetical protein
MAYALWRVELAFQYGKCHTQAMEPTATEVTRSIRLHLADKGRSQGWLARELGVTNHWVSRRMTGKTPWTTDDVDLVAGALKVSPIALLMGSVPERSETQSAMQAVA